MIFLTDFPPFLKTTLPYLIAGGILCLLIYRVLYTGKQVQIPDSIGLVLGSIWAFLLLGFYGLLVAVPAGLIAYFQIPENVNEMSVINRGVTVAKPAMLLFGFTLICSLIIPLSKRIVSYEFARKKAVNIYNYLAGFLGAIMVLFLTFAIGKACQVESSLMISGLFFILLLFFHTFYSWLIKDVLKPFYFEDIKLLKRGDRERFDAEKIKHWEKAYRIYPSEKASNRIQNYKYGGASNWLYKYNLELNQKTNE